MELAILHKDSLPDTRMGLLPISSISQFYFAMITSPDFKIFIEENNSSIRGALVLQLQPSNLFTKLKLRDYLNIIFSVIANPRIWLVQTIQSIYLLKNAKGFVIHAVYLDAASRGQKLGKKIISKAMTYSSEKSQNLFVTTKDSNQISIKVYRDLGFRQDKSFGDAIRLLISIEGLKESSFSIY